MIHILSLILHLPADVFIAIANLASQAARLVQFTYLDLVSAGHQVRRALDSVHLVLDGLSPRTQAALAYPSSSGQRQESSDGAPAWTTSDKRRTSRIVRLREIRDGQAVTDCGILMRTDLRTFGGDNCSDE